MTTGKILRLMSLVLMSVLVSAVWSASPLVRQGDQAFRGQDLAGAHAAYGLALERDPHDLDANFMRALTLFTDLFENPTAEIESVLAGWGVTYERDLLELTKIKVLYVRDVGAVTVPHWDSVQKTLERNGFQFDIHNTAVGGLPLLGNLTSYLVVVWDMGMGGVLDNDRHLLMVNYLLGAAGNLLLAGDAVLQAPVDAFPQQVLQIDGVLLNIGVGGEALTGVVGDPVTDGMSALRLEDGGAAADAFTPTAAAEVILRDDQGRARALRWQDPVGGGRLVFYAGTAGRLLRRRGRVDPYFQVWGGDTAITPGQAPTAAGYERIGGGTGTELMTFARAYDYYLVYCPYKDESAVLDAVQKANAPAAFLVPVWTTGTTGAANVHAQNEPDGAYMFVNTQAVASSFLLNAVGQDVWSLQFYGDASGADWPWEDPDNVDTLLERALAWFGVAPALHVPLRAPPGAPTINSTVDAVTGGLNGRIDTALSHLAELHAADYLWGRTFPLPLGNVAGTGNAGDELILDRIDGLFLQAMLHYLKYFTTHPTGYDLDVDYDVMDETDWDPQAAYWNEDTTGKRFLALRGGRESAFIQAKASLEASLESAREAVELLLGCWEGRGLLANAGIPRSTLQQALDEIEDGLNSLDAGPTLIEEPGHDPILLDIGRLFTDPPARDAMPPAVDRTSSTGHVNTKIDWDAVPDRARFDGLFADAAWSRAAFYARMNELLISLEDTDYTRTFGDRETGPGGALLLADGETPTLYWGVQDGWYSSFRRESNQGVRGFNYLLRDLQFEEFIERFEVWRRVTDPPDQAGAAELVATLTPAQFAAGAVWRFEDTAFPGALVEYEYHVNIVFVGSDVRSEYALKTEPLRFARDSDDNGLGDWWEVLYTGATGVVPGVDDDLDGLSNSREYELRSNPRATNTDGDAFSDAEEERAGLSPRVAESEDDDLDDDDYTNREEVDAFTDANDVDENPGTVMALEVVSVATTGEPADDECGTAAISADGRVVVFLSAAGNLDPGRGAVRGVVQVYLRDRDTAQTTCVSVNDAGVAANADCSDVAISADGNVVAFASSATNLVTGGNAVQDIYVRDRATQQTHCVSVSTAGAQATSGSWGPALSADGSCAAFTSYAGNLVTGDTNARSDVFVRDRTAGTTTRVSVSATRAQSNGHSTEADISGDGQLVVFTSSATNLIASDANFSDDVFVHDRATGATALVSIDSDGFQSYCNSMSGAITGNGRYIAFVSWCDNLASGAVSFVRNVYRRDRMLGRTAWVRAADNFAYSPNGLFLAGGTGLRNMVSRREFITPLAGAFAAADDSTLVAGLAVAGFAHTQIAALYWKDTDTDLLSDRWELEHCFDPRVADDSTVDDDLDAFMLREEALVETDYRNGDTDGDSMPDGWEFRKGLDPWRADADENPDGDILINRLEFIADRSPLIFDDFRGAVLDRGWNQVSIPSDVADATAGRVFGGRIVPPVWGWDALSQRYTPVSLVRDGATLSETTGYFVYAPHANVVWFDAIPEERSREDVVIVLEPGWNLVSIPTFLLGRTIAEVFGNAILGSVWTWNSWRGWYVVVSDDNGLFIDSRGIWVFALAHAELRFTPP